jgi:hypothetical protein
MSDEDRLSQLNNDLNEAHTLVEIARRTIWSAETHPENADEPSERMRRILEHLDQAHAVIDTVLDEVEAERTEAGAPGDGPGSRPIIH